MKRKRSPTTSDADAQDQAENQQTAQAGVFTGVQKLDVKIDLNPRYGTWDQTQLNIVGGPALPSYLRADSLPKANAVS